MKRVRVLVTDAGSTKSLAVVRALGATHDVLTVSSSRFSLAAWSRYTRRHLMMPPEDAGFARAILDLCVRHEIDVVIPPEEQSSFLLARDRAMFEAKGVRVAAPPLQALEVTMDKARTIEAARRARVPIPLSVVPTSEDEAVTAARDFGYPVVIKPRFSHYWAGDRFITTDGVSYAGSEPELRAALRKAPPAVPIPLIQEYIPGTGHGVFFMIGRNGSVLAEFAHERLRDLRPTGSGSVLRRSVPMDPELRSLSVGLLRQIGWRGAAMAEFRRDALSGEAKLMEINGRLWGSLQLATDAGVNFPALIVDDALNGASPTSGYTTGVVLRWWLGDLVRLARVFRGPPPGYSGHFPSRLVAMREFLGPQPPGTRQEMLRWSDPLPAIGEIVSVLVGRR